MFQRSCDPAFVQFGFEVPQVLSTASPTKPETTFFNTLFVKVMSLTTAIFPLCPDRTVSRTAVPVCAAAHTFSIVLESNSTRCALLISRAFFSVHLACGRRVTPAFAHDSGL